MAHVPIPLTIEQGTYKVFPPIALVDEQTGAPLDLTLATTVRFRAVASLGQPDAIYAIDKGRNAGLDIAAPASAGVVTLTLAPADTARVLLSAPATYLWSIRAFFSSTNTVVGASGTLVVAPVADRSTRAL